MKIASKTGQICNARSAIFLHSFLTFAHKNKRNEKDLLFHQCRDSVVIHGLWPSADDKETG
jgi:hypothetical protein